LAAQKRYSVAMSFSFPKIYPILDSKWIPQENRAGFLDRLGRSLADAGVALLEYRNKPGTEAEILADAAILRRALPAGQVKLMLDDRAEWVERVGFDGAHVDAGDLSPAEARKVLGPERILGTFGGSTEFLPGILDAPVDYLAVGPVFTTTTKHTDKPPIGIEGVRRMRALAGPDRVLSCAAGVTLATAPEVLAAGGSMVVVSQAIFGAEDPAAEFRRWLAALS
jgi:thiamine-phosphate pyrophosphorylase